MATAKELPSPSAPLRKNRLEKYAQARARGLNQTDSWAATYPKGAKVPAVESLRVGGSRAESRKEVQQRIRFLIRARRLAANKNDVTNTPDTYDRDTIIRLSLEITQALENALEAGQQSGLSNTKIGQLKTVLGQHLARQGKLAESKENDDLTPLNAPSAEDWERAYNVEVCRC